MDTEQDMGGVTMAIESIAGARNKVQAIRQLIQRGGYTTGRAKELIEYVTKQYPHTNDHWEKKE